MFDRVLNPPIFRSKKFSRSLVMPHNILWKLPPFIIFYKALQSDVKNRTKYVWSAGSEHDTAQKMKFSIQGFFSFFRKLRIWSHLLKKSLMEIFIFCAVRIGFYNLSRNLFPIHAVYAYMLENTEILEIIEIKGSMDKKLVDSFIILFCLLQVPC